jgi:hypothetical protein
MKWKTTRQTKQMKSYCLPPSPFLFFFVCRNIIISRYDLFVLPTHHSAMKTREISLFDE